MAHITRRSFIKQSAAGAAALTLGRKAMAANKNNSFLGPVALGDSGIITSRVALGTGSFGWKHTSQQVKLGKEKFLEMAQYAYEKGIRFFETADIYGSHQLIGDALKLVPRDKVVVETKIWHRPVDWIDYKNVPNSIDRFRKEIRTDYLDIVLLHCQVEEDWSEKYKREMDDLNNLQAKGVIGAVGVSCHDLKALNTAAESDWVQVIQTRINPFGPRMDAEPEKVMPVIKKAHDNGKGIIGMKIFGCGECVEEEQRQKSLEYVWGSGNVDAMTIGFGEIAHIDDALSRMEKILA
jgi:1-deoxyxylulose-5-phosphate synthase